MKTTPLSIHKQCKDFHPRHLVYRWKELPENPVFVCPGCGKDLKFEIKQSDDPRYLAGFIGIQEEDDITGLPYGSCGCDDLVCPGWVSPTKVVECPCCDRRFINDKYNLLSSHFPVSPIKS